MERETSETTGAGAGTGAVATGREAGPLYFFDVSSIRDYLAQTRRFSGIQRVVSMILSEIFDRMDGSRFYLAYQDRASGRFTSVRGDALDLDPASADELFAFFFPDNRDGGSIPALAKYRATPTKYYYHRTRLDLAAFLGKEQSFRRYNMTGADWREQRRRKSAPVPSTIPKHDMFDIARPGDKLVLLDSSWLAQYQESFRRAKESGMDVVTLVYDLIPIVMPGAQWDMMPAIFYNWLLDSTEYTNRYMAISEASRRDLLDFFGRHGKSFECDVLALTQATVKPRRAEAPSGPLTERIDAEAYPLLAQTVTMENRLRMMSLRPFVLIVGTVEVRKNIWYAVLAWKKLVDAGHYDLPKLVFAGRLGWGRHEFDHVLISTGHVYGYVEVFDGPSDEELDFLYRNCLFTMMPSLYEGWGLPVGESLSYGKTAVISNTGSLPEVGGDMVEYCDPTSVDSIAEAARRLAFDPERRAALERKIAETRLRTWGDVADDLMRIIG